MNRCKRNNKLIKNIISYLFIIYISFNIIKIKINKVVVSFFHFIKFYNIIYNFFFLLNKVVLQQRFRSYLFFGVVTVLLSCLVCHPLVMIGYFFSCCRFFIVAFDLSTSYCDI